MTTIEQTVGKKEQPQEQGSELRRLILKSKLTVTPRESYSPFTSEKLMYASNARTLLSDFETLKGKFLELDDKLQSVSETVRSQSVKQANNAKLLFEHLTRDDVGTEDEERKARQDKLNKLSLEVDSLIKKIDDRVKQEEETEKARVKEEDRRQGLIKSDRELVEKIGTSFDDLKATCGNKIEPKTSKLIDELRLAFAAVTTGTRPLTDPERKDAKALHETGGQQIKDLDTRHAKLVERMTDEDLQIPAGALDTEQGSLGGKRDEVDTLLNRRPLLSGNLDTATSKIDTLALAVKSCVSAVAERKRLADLRAERGRAITVLLSTEAYAIPGGADEKETVTLGSHHKVITDALAGEAPTIDGLKLAEKTLVTLGETVAKAKLSIAERMRNTEARSKRGREILDLLKTDGYTIPQGANETQTGALGKDRKTIAEALKTEPPGTDALALAEKTLLDLAKAVAQAKHDISEATEAPKRPKALKERFSKIDLDTFGPLLKKDLEFKLGRKFVEAMLGGDPATLTEAEFNEASSHLDKMERRIEDRTGDYEGQQQGARKWLASFTYLDGEINKVNATDKGAARGFATRRLQLKLEVEERLKLDILAFTATIAYEVENKLNDMNALAIEVQDKLHPPTGPVTAFDWQDPRTWQVQKIRYVGGGTEGYVGGLSGADPGLITRISKADVGDRHSAAKICTGKPMHQHTDAGSGGISFGYSHMGGIKVEPVIYDFANRRNGNTYQWAYDAPSSGPSGLPGSVKAKV